MCAIGPTCVAVVKNHGNHGGMDHLKHGLLEHFARRARPFTRVVLYYCNVFMFHLVFVYSLLYAVGGESPSSALGLGRKGEAHDVAGKE